MKTECTASVARQVTILGRNQTQCLPNNEVALFGESGHKNYLNYVLYNFCLVLFSWTLKQVTKTQAKCFFINQSTMVKWQKSIIKNIPYLKKDTIHACQRLIHFFIHLLQAGKGMALSSRTEFSSMASMLSKRVPRNSNLTLGNRKKLTRGHIWTVRCLVDDIC